MRCKGSRPRLFLSPPFDHILTTFSRLKRFAGVIEGVQGTFEMVGETLLHVGENVRVRIKGNGYARVSQRLVQRIKRALDTLNEGERELIELKYFSTLIRSDLAIYEKLGYSKRQGRRIKAAALRKLAIALNLI